MDEKELHEHHHDHECDCGCDHGHEHHHEHDHHGHECHDPNCTDPSHHHHEHECADSNCTDPSHHHHHHHKDGEVEITHHEGAVIGALKGVMPVADYDQAEKLLAEQMRQAGQKITTVGGIIGHIKFVLSTVGRCGQISVTDVDENIRRFDGAASQVEGVAIVFAVEDDTLSHILEETIGSLFEKNE